MNKYVNHHLTKNTNKVHCFSTCFEVRVIDGQNGCPTHKFKNIIICEI